jgi:hypothetical protein
MTNQRRVQILSVEFHLNLNDGLSRTRNGLFMTL